MASPFSFSQLQNKKIHLAVCGSVAAYKAVDLLRLYQKAGLTVSVTLTPAAQRFVTPLTFEALGASQVFTTMFGQDSGVSFAHLMPGAIADVFVIAPASAATIARLATGQADTLLAAQALAYSGQLVLAPAMNPRMWTHPATQANVSLLIERGGALVQPASGLVACGDEGTGKLASLEDIYYVTLKSIAKQDYTGKNVMLTVGPTRERWDGVRYWTNPSTGYMGSALAVAAWARGATVHAVTGPGVPPLPQGIIQHPVESAKEMFAQAEQLWPSADIGIFTAAVADFSPIPFGTGKFKKTASPQGVTIEFRPNMDILHTLGHRKQPHQKIIGFAAETNGLEASVHKKLTAKNADIIAGNVIGQAGSGFASQTNHMYLADRNGKTETLPDIKKTDAAWRLLDWLLTL